jgi:hypothetical protein
MKSVLRNNLRLIRNGDGREELFDFADDLDERTDLAKVPERRGDLQLLREALSAMLPPPTSAIPISRQ